MILESLLIGVIVGMLFYEFTGVSPGGVVAPGYLALYIHQPARIAVTVVFALVIWGLLELSARHLILYGRRRLLAAVVLSIGLKFAVDAFMLNAAPVPLDIHAIGIIIPGLIANECVRQRVIPTVAAVTIVTIAVFLIMRFVIA